MALARYLRVAGTNAVCGEVEISGSKNATLALMAAAVLCETPVRLKGVPWIQDISMMMSVLEEAGGKAIRQEDDLIIEFNADHPRPISYEVSKELRASILVMGGLLGRYGEAVVSRPGGCELGQRPVNLHIEGMKALGASIVEEHGDFICRADQGLKGAVYVLPTPSVGATENVLVAAVCARGTTVIVNAAQEPEIQHLIRFLKACGARIEGEASPQLVVEGVERLRGCEYTVPRDRIEAATYLALVGATTGELTLVGAPAEEMTAVLERARECGLQVEVRASAVTVKSGERPKPMNLETGPYPGFPTDVQPPFVAMLSRATGQSMVVDHIFENRFNYVGEMTRMGAKIKVQNRVAIVEGQERLQGADVEARDLRGGAALVVAAASAEDVSRIFGIQHIERGYERLAEKLRGIGVFAEISDGVAPAFV
ncbi:MAG: UDP-N-acetylglucosamine 1-carboxyvinyltransferase [bacterium JZ-2024 1]